MWYQNNHSHFVSTTVCIVGWFSLLWNVPWFSFLYFSTLSLKAARFTRWILRVAMQSWLMYDGMLGAHAVKKLWRECEALKRERMLNFHGSRVRAKSIFTIEGNLWRVNFNLNSSKLCSQHQLSNLY